jgi:hypothetical protein
LAAQRVRRHRARAVERAEHDAYVQDRRVRWFAERLLTTQPEAARVLATEVPYELAADLVQELARRLTELERPPE